MILLTGWGQRLVADGDVPAHVDRVLSKPPRLREVRAALAQLTLPAWPQAAAAEESILDAARELSNTPVAGG